MVRYSDNPEIIGSGDYLLSAIDDLRKAYHEAGISFPDPEPSPYFGAAPVAAVRHFPE